MKLFIASDLHGSSVYCKKMIDAFEREKAERMILLGDILYHGARNGLTEGYDTKSVCLMLNEYSDSILAVRGNCDSEVDQQVLDFPLRADYAVLYLNGRMVFATHGHYYNEFNPPPMHKGDILLHGHTHIPACEDKSDYLYFNPGSVSLPKHGSVNGYILFEDGVFKWKNLDGIEYNEYSLL